MGRSGPRPLPFRLESHASPSAKRMIEDSILALIGLGKHIWADEDPDEYVRRLREGWE